MMIHAIATTSLILMIIEIIQDQPGNTSKLIVELRHLLRQS